MTDTFFHPEPDDSDPVVELWRMETEARAIAPIVGADHNTVARDLAGVANETPAPRPITGRDGKTYTPQTQQRPPARMAPGGAALPRRRQTRQV